MLIQIQCPNCGANMEVDDSQAKLHCKHCRCEITVPTKNETAKKPGGAWKKVLSKGAFVVSCIVIAVVLIGGAGYLTLRTMRGCRRGSVVPAQATPTPEPTPLPDRVYSADKNPDFAPPIDALGISEGHLEDYAEALADRTRWIDLTPEGASGFTVIRSIDLGCSYVVENGQYYRLGEGEDGKGVVDVLLTDLDLDDEPDLLYTYHFGANEDAVSKVGWFRFTTHTSALSGFSQRDGFLSLIEEDGVYYLFRAVRDVDLDTGTFGLTLTERLGEITETMGGIGLIMDPPPTPEAPAE